MEIVWWVGFLHAQSFLVVVLFGWYNIIPRFPHVLPSIHISIADLGWYYVSYWYWVEMHIFLWSNQLNPSSTCTSGGNIWLIAWAGHLEMIRTVGVLLVQLKYESIESNWFFSPSLSLSLFLPVALRYSRVFSGCSSTAPVLQRGQSWWEIWAHWVPLTKANSQPKSVSSELKSGQHAP